MAYSKQKYTLKYILITSSSLFVVVIGYWELLMIYSHKQLFITDWLIEMQYYNDCG